MKTLLLTAAATALILAAPTAFAADDHHGHPGGGGAPHDTHAAAPAHTAAPTHGAPSMMMKGPAMTGHTDHAHHDMTTKAAPTAPPGWTVKGHPAENHTAHGTNAMHGGNSHANFHRHNVTASHHYHYRGGSYQWPSGYHYQRWSFGMTLPSIFWAQQYWISDYGDYGLSYPPPGCVWVRYGDDAILIDQYSGEILEVVYNQFD